MPFDIDCVSETHRAEVSIEQLLRLIHVGVGTAAVQPLRSWTVEVRLGELLMLVFPSGKSQM